VWVPGPDGDLSAKQVSPHVQPPSQRHFFALADSWKDRLRAGFMALKGVCFANYKGIAIKRVGIRSPYRWFF
jgi:hypothetical protein